MIANSAFSSGTSDEDLFRAVAEYTQNMRPPTVSDRLSEFRAKIRAEVGRTDTAPRAMAERMKKMFDQTVQDTLKDVSYTDRLGARQKRRSLVKRYRRENNFLLREVRRLKGLLRAAGPASVSQTSSFADNGRDCTIISTGNGEDCVLLSDGDDQGADECGWQGSVDDLFCGGNDDNDDNDDDDSETDCEDIGDSNVRELARMLEAESEVAAAVGRAVVLRPPAQSDIERVLEILVVDV